MKITKRFIIIFSGIALLTFASYISTTFSSKLVILASEYDYAKIENQLILPLEVEENEIIDIIYENPYLYHPSSSTSFYFTSNRYSENLDGTNNSRIFDGFDFFSRELPQFHIFKGRYIFD